MAWSWKGSLQLTSQEHQTRAGGPRHPQESNFWTHRTDELGSLFPRSDQFVKLVYIQKLFTRDTSSLYTHVQKLPVMAITMWKLGVSQNFSLPGSLNHRPRLKGFSGYKLYLPTAETRGLHTAAAPCYRQVSGPVSKNGTTFHTKKIESRFLTVWR